MGGAFRSEYSAEDYIVTYIRDVTSVQTGVYGYMGIYTK